MTRSFLAAAFVLALFASVLPAHALDAETPQGVMVVNVADQDGNTFSGSWFVHQGLGQEGQVVRNGTRGEAFRLSPGYYYLEVRNVRGYESMALVGVNPVLVQDGGTSERLVLYYKTAADAARVGTQVTPVWEPTLGTYTTYGDTPSTPRLPEQERLLRAKAAAKAKKEEKTVAFLVEPIEAEAVEEQEAPAPVYQLAKTGVSGLPALIGLSFLASLALMRRRRSF